MFQPHNIESNMMKRCIEILVSARKRLGKFIRERLRYFYNRRNNQALNIFSKVHDEHSFPFSSPIFHAQGIRSGTYFFKFNLKIWNYINHCHFSSTRSSEALSPDITVITCSNSSTKTLLVRSLEHLGIPSSRVIILGQDMSPWINIRKLELLSSYLKTVSTRYVLYCDADDVIIVNSAGMVKALEKYQCKMLFNAERTMCYAKNFNRAFERSIVYDISKNPYTYLNSGVWIAETDFATKICTEGFLHGPEKTEPLGDQAVYKAMYKKYYPLIKIDSERLLCQTIQFSEFGDFKVA